jgi:5-methylcytosine-specific restriction endonuclease McrA
MNKWKCYYCGKELREGEECTCEKSKEKKNYITTNTVKTDKGYKCLCGNGEFEMISHMDFSDRYTHTYKCTKCGNCIGLDFQREIPLD